MFVFPSTLSIFFAVLLSFLPSASADSLTSEGLLIYDAELDIYWMQDGNFNGLMTWNDANAWAENLSYGGYNDWHLPTTPDGTWGYDGNGNPTKYNVTASDLGHLYHMHHALLSLTVSEGTQNDTPFFNGLQAWYYWCSPLSKTLDGAKNPMAWIFDFKYGTQFLASTNTYAYAIAVRKATSTPEPSSLLLFLIGLSGLCCVRRQKKR